MAKATTTIRQILNYQAEHGAWFAANQDLFNRVTVDLNLEVCTIRTVEGTILATTFLGGGRRVNGKRSQQLGRIARNRRKIGMMAEGEQDNADLWHKIRNVDDSLFMLRWGVRRPRTIPSFLQTAHAVKK